MLDLSNWKLKLFRFGLERWLHRMLKLETASLLCVWCENRIDVRIPTAPFGTCVTCSQCKRQILVVGHPFKPHGLNPKTLKDGVGLCKWGCDFIEPYGFVPMADCPVHD